MNGPSLIIYTSIRQQLYPPSYVHCTYILAMSKQTARHHALPRIIQEDKKKKRNVCVCWLFPFFQKKVHENGQEQNNNQVPVSCWVSPSSPSTRLCPLHFLPKIKIKKGTRQTKICFLKIKKWLTGKKRDDNLYVIQSHTIAHEKSCVLFEWFSRCQFSNLCYSVVDSFLRRHPDSFSVNSASSVYVLYVLLYVYIR